MNFAYKQIRTVKAKTDATGRQTGIIFDGTKSLYDNDRILIRQKFSTYKKNVEKHQ